MRITIKMTHKLLIVVGIIISSCSEYETYYGERDIPSLFEGIYQTKEPVVFDSGVSTHFTLNIDLNYKWTLEANSTDVHFKGEIYMPKSWESSRVYLRNILPSHQPQPSRLSVRKSYKEHVWGVFFWYDGEYVSLYWNKPSESTDGSSFAVSLLGFFLVSALISLAVMSYKGAESRKTLIRIHQDRYDTVNKINKLDSKIDDMLIEFYAIPPCSRCGETRFYSIQENSVHSIQIECVACKKKIWLKPLNKTNDSLFLMIQDRNGLLRKTDWMTEIPEGISSTEGIGKIEEPSFYYINSNISAKVSTRKSTTRRRTIPKHVKQEVWQRDQGTCVECGSKERLEYDHIIPVSKGGANTMRNIQLLCEDCNRAKGARIE
jgi:hypothetical protein